MNGGDMKNVVVASLVDRRGLLLVSLVLIPVVIVVVVVVIVTGSLCVENYT